MEEANAEYTLLHTANHWGPKGKVDSGNAPEGLSLMKTEINNLVQNQVSAALKQTDGANNGSQKPCTCHICRSMKHLKKDCPKKDDNDAKKPPIPRAAWKAWASQMTRANKNCQWQTMTLVCPSWFLVIVTWNFGS